LRNGANTTNTNDLRCRNGNSLVDNERPIVARMIRDGGVGVGEISSAAATVRYI